ncbi:hypothetical protein PCK1_001042 [Pneumocystis canis]|nr:hypothetical protein PCK1_001042 [Pneumocystis canis]
MSKVRQKMMLKILYSFDEKHLMTCLAWHENPISVEIMSLSNIYEHKVGIVSLKTCVLTVIAKSPELVLQKGSDFAVYTLDPVEEKEVFSGQGMLSWILDISRQTKSNCKNVLGKIKRSAKIGEKNETALEIVMRLSKVPSVTETNLLNIMQDFCFFDDSSNPLISGISKTISPKIFEKNEYAFFEPSIYTYNSLKSTNIEAQNNFQKNEEIAFNASKSSVLLPSENLCSVEVHQSFSPVSFSRQVSSPISESISPQMPSSSSSLQYQQLPPSSPPIFPLENQMSYPTSEPSLPLPDLFETSSFIHTASNSQKFTNYLQLPQLDTDTISIEDKRDTDNKELPENDIDAFKFSTHGTFITAPELNNNNSNEISIDELPERKKLTEAVRAAKLALENLSVIKLTDSQIEENDKISIDFSEIYGGYILVLILIIKSFIDKKNNKNDKLSKHSGKKISNALRIEMNLLKSIQEGKIPNYCNNCGTIKTVSWRRVKTTDDRPEETLCNRIMRCLVVKS